MKLVRTIVGVAAVLALAGTYLSAASSAPDKVVTIGFQKYGNLILLKGRGGLESRLAPLGFRIEWRELDQRFTAIMVTHDVAEAVTLADRVLMIEDGGILLDHRIDLPRPRERGSPEVAALEGRILRELFRNAGAGEDA